MFNPDSDYKHHRGNTKPCISIECLMICPLQISDAPRPPFSFTVTASFTTCVSITCITLNTIMPTKRQGFCNPYTCIAAISSCKGLFFLIIVRCSLLEEDYDDDPSDIFLKDRHHNPQLTMLIAKPKPPSFHAPLEVIKTVCI